MSEHAFISYVREDADAVDRLATQLRSNGVRVWLDRERIEPGARWKDAIRRAIESGAFFLACFSRSSGARDKTYMNEELLLAIEQLRQRTARKAWFIPVLLDDCEVPDLTIAPGETLASLQYVALYEEWQEGVARILSVIRPESALGSEVRLRVTPAPEGIRPRERAFFALDFGTSYSTAVIPGRDGEPVFVPAGDGRTLIPSVVSVDESLDYRVGWQAVEVASRHPERTVWNVKRLLGGSGKVKIGSHEYEPESVAALIIGSLLKNTREYLGHDLAKALVAVPANFNVVQSNALARACEMAGVQIERMIAEPNAAGLLLADSIRTGESGRFLVLDLGGGTFDVSILEFGDDCFEAKAVVGSNELGGADYDEALFQLALSNVSELLEGDALARGISQSDLSRLRSEAARAKIALSSRHQTSIILPNLEVPGYGFRDLEVTIDRARARQAFKDLDALAERCIRRALEMADCRVSDLRSVVMAGQGLKVFSLQERIEHLFLTLPLVRRYQEGAVGRGLSRYVRVLEGDEKNLLLLDSNYTGIAVECSKVLKRKSGEATADFELTTKAERHHELFELLPFFQTTIPVRRNYSARLATAGAARLRLVELGSDPDSRKTNLATIDLPALKKGAELDLVLDIDANRTILLWIGLRDRKEYHGYQLNNLFKEASGTPHWSWEGRQRDGFEVRPIKKLQPS